MTHVSYTDLRQNLARYMDEAVRSGAPITVTRQAGKGDIVILSANEFEAWRETVHLLRSPRNAERLMRSIGELDAGGGQVQELVEESEDPAVR